MAARINSKNKGNTFERKIANKLSARFEEYTGIKTSFRRNSDSGSYFGGTNQKRLQTHDAESASLGDIICPKTFKYSLECKHYKTAPSLFNIMQQDCKQWDSWIVQAEQDSKNVGKDMAIIMKYNNIEEMVILTSPIPDVYNMPYKNHYVVFLKYFLDRPDLEFFESD